MNNKLHNAFDEITADDRLKEKTLQYLANHQESDKKRSFLPRYLAVAASLLLLILASGFSYNFYFTPVSYVDIDVNPSIELVINKLGKVIQASAYNTDGEQILSAVKIKYKSYEDALALLIKTMDEEGYIAADGLISVTVQSDSQETEVFDTVQKDVSNILSSQQLNLEQDIFIVDSETKLHAHDMNVSPAKYLAIAELLEVDPTATVAECQNHTISELKEYTRQHQHRHGNDEATESEDSADGMSNECVDETAAECVEDATGNAAESESNHHNQQQNQNRHHE